LRRWGSDGARRGAAGLDGCGFSHAQIHFYTQQFFQQPKLFSTREELFRPPAIGGEVAADFELAVAELKPDGGRVVLPAIEGVGGAENRQHLPHRPTGVCRLENVVITHLGHRPAMMPSEIRQAPSLEVAQWQQPVDQQHLAPDLRVPPIAHSPANIVDERAEPEHPPIKPAKPVFHMREPVELFGQHEYARFVPDRAEPPVHPPGERSFF